MNEDKLKQAVLLYKQGNKSQAAILLGEIGLRNSFSVNLCQKYPRFFKIREIC